MKPSTPSRGGLVFGIPVAAVLVSPLSADVLTWNNSSANGLWSTPANWNTGFRPQSTDDAIFPAGLGGALSLGVDGGYFPTARSIQFNDNYTIGGTFTRSIGGGVDIGVAAGSTVNWSAGLTLSGDLVKSGSGTLVIGTTLSTPSGVSVNGGVLRANSSASLGGTDDIAKVNDGGTLELNNFHHPHPIYLFQGSTLKGIGSASTNFSTNSLVISNTATAVSIGAAGPADVLRTDYMIGGSTSTVMTMTGDGTLRLNSANTFLASWVIPSGKVQMVGTLETLGQHSAGSVTLSGGTLAVELSASPGDYTDGPGNNIFVTAHSTFLNDRAGLGTGRSATFGTLTMGAQTLSVAAGPSVTSGDAGFYFGNLTLTGNPSFSITQGNTGPGHLGVMSLTGGGVPRTITKTGPGNLSFYGGSTELAAGSTVTAAGGGTLLLNLPAIGPDTVTAVTMAQNPIGDANLSMTDGTLMLRGHGAAAIYALSNRLTLGGSVIVDPDRNVSGYVNDVFRVADITLKPGTVMGVSGDSSFGIGSLGPMILEGNATLEGFNSGTTADGVCFLYGGISGGPASALTIGNTVRPINLTIAASSTYGGGTVMNGGNVTLNAASGFGTGTTTLNGGNLTLNADAALNGTVTINGGNLIVMGQNILSANPVVLNGGALDFRTTAHTTWPIPSLTVSGTSALGFSRFGSTSSFVVTAPVIDVSGTTTLTLSNGASTSHLIQQFALAGDLTVSASSAARVTSITEDGTPRKFIKTGTAQLDLEGVSSHSGGTEVLAGTLFVENSAALGSGALTIGATSGTAAATAAFAAGLTIPNDIVIRSGSSGAATLDSISGNVTWTGSVHLQKSVTLDNGSGLSQFNGPIGGAGDISKISGGEIVLANVANSFGSGTATSVSISAGNLTVAADAALGNPTNGVNLTGSGALKINGTFGTSRTLTVTGASSGVNVTAGNTFTMNSPVAGTGTFWKSDAGTLEFAPAVDATARGSAITAVAGGILRVRGQKNLGDASPISMDNGGAFEFARDPDTNFAHPVSLLGHGGIRVDRAPGGSGTNGRHTLGAINVTTISGNSLTVSGENGYGLTATGYTSAANSTVTNNAPGTFILGSLTGNPGTASRTLTIGGSGDISITGATGQGAGAGTYGIVKTGAGKLSFGSSLAGFSRVLTVNDGTFDLNSNAYASTQVVTMGGAASVLGPRIETGAAGLLTLGAGLTFSNTGSPAGGTITGNLSLGSAAQAFTINPASGSAPALTIDGPISGSAGASLVKSGAGTLRFTGAGNTQPGPVSINNGILELAKTSGHAIGAGGLDINPTTNNATVKLLAAGQIHDNAAVNLSGASEVFLDLNNFTETVGPVSLTQTDVNDYTAVKTGATGTLVLNGNLAFHNNINSASNEERNVLITGTGSETVPAFDGFLDLGGVNRTIHVTTNVVGANEPRANATIETRIVNGGIVKTGPRTLYLTNPNNTFAGGLQIAQGFVRPGSMTSLGLGPVTFTNPPGTAAGLDFGSLTGTLPNEISTGTGDFTFTYAAPAPNALTLGGGFDLAQNLVVDVVNGSVQNGIPNDVNRAVVHVTGTIDDGAGTFGLTKVGNGLLRLAAGNTYSGATTVGRGILSLAADSSLGDTAAPLTLNGGCLAASNSFTLSRDVAIGANGGSLRADAVRTMELTGALDWGSATTGTDGSGRIVISGPTTGSGNIIIGESIAFASGTPGQQLTRFNKLCLQGPATLPSGNVSFGGNGVLELATGDFTRPLGTGPGQVQLPTNVGGGWAAIGADRIVNIGGASAPMTWGQMSPPFLYKDGPSTADFGQILLGSTTATHTVEFQNPLVFPASGSFVIARGVTCMNGAAAVDGRITGNAYQNDPVRTADFVFTGDGTLEMAGDLIGKFMVSQNGYGKTILSGNNTGLTQDISVFIGTLALANDASMGTPFTIMVYPEGTLDAAAMTGPVMTRSSGQLFVFGLLDGDARANGTLFGNGTITGDVSVAASASIDPGLAGTLHLGGDLTMESGSALAFETDGIVPEVNHTRMRVTGTVNLDGHLDLDGGTGLLQNDSMVLLLNDGSDPIHGTFDGLPEGATIPIGNGLAFRITYLANGDGGPVGNDLGVTVVADIGTDLALSADAPLAVALGANFAVTYTIGNLGPNDSPGSSLEIELPPAAVLIGSTPAGSVTGNVLTIPLAAVANGASTTATVDFTAPGTPASIFVAPWIYNSGGDGNSGNDYAPSMTAVLPGGVPVIETFTKNLVNDEVTLGIHALADIRYLLESSTDLEHWNDLFEFEGGGSSMQFTRPMGEPEEFFRFKILPYDDGIEVE